MAITAANRDSGSQDAALNNGNTQATASIAFQNSRLYVVTCCSRGTAPMGITSITGGGITWTEAATPFTGTGPNMSIFTGLTTSGATTQALTITVSGGPTSSFKWIVDEFTGVDTTTPVVQAAAVVSGVNQPTGTVALSAFADGVDNVAYGVFAHNIGEAFTADASGGWSILVDNQTTVAGVIVQASEWKTGEDTSVTMTWATNTDRWSGTALEIKAAAAAVTRKLQVVTTPARW
jgi:hypothetical protein